MEINARVINAFSAAVTLTGVVGAAAVWTGAPLAPATIARHAQDAARNSSEAVLNLTEAEISTDALHDIAENVRVQLETSRRMLDTQLQIESSTRRGGGYARAIAERIRSINRVLARLKDGLAVLGMLSLEATLSAEDAAAAAGMLGATLDVLQDAYDQVIDESRELNRKSRGYAELRDGPDS